MKKTNRYLLMICLVLTVCILASCANAAPEPVKLNTYGSILFLSSYEEIPKAKAEADPEYEPEFDLEGLTHYYIPVFAEAWCELRTVEIMDTNFISCYTFNDSKQNDLVLQMYRTPDPQATMEWILKNNEGKMKPWEGVEGVYCKEVSSSLGEQIQFYFMYDGECFFMPITPALMDEIKAKAPEALKGPLFELKKVELKTEPK